MKIVLGSLLILFLLSGCNEHKTQSIKQMRDGVLLIGVKGDNLLLTGIAADSVIQILRNRHLYDSDSLWFSINNETELRSPHPPPGFENPGHGEPPHYDISVGTSEQKRQIYLKSLKSFQPKDDTPTNDSLII